MAETPLKCKWLLLNGKLTFCEVLFKGTCLWRLYESAKSPLRQDTSWSIVWRRRDSASPFRLTAVWWLELSLWYTMRYTFPPCLELILQCYEVDAGTWFGNAMNGICNDWRLLSADFSEPWETDTDGLRQFGTLTCLFPFEGCVHSTSVSAITDSFWASRYL